MALNPDNHANTVIHGDCFDVMQSLPDNSFDAIITDPPFFVPADHYQSRVKWKKSYGDLTPLRMFMRNFVAEAVRVLKPTGHLMVFCNGESYGPFFEPIYSGFDSVRSLVWDKGKVGLGRGFRHQHELVIWARWRESVIQDDTSARSDILRYEATKTAERTHPVEKPSAMLAELVSVASPTDGLVLDPFAGSGTTGEGALRVGRQFVGIEIDESYAQLANDRLLKALEQYVPGEARGLARWS